MSKQCDTVSTEVTLGRGIGSECPVKQQNREKSNKSYGGGEGEAKAFQGVLAFAFKENRKNANVQKMRFCDEEA